MKLNPQFPFNIRIISILKQRRKTVIAVVIAMIIISLVMLYQFQNHDKADIDMFAQDEDKRIPELGTDIEVPGSIDSTYYDSNTDADDIEKRDTTAIKKELEEYIADFEGQYGIYYINLKTGDEFGINDTDEYIAASTVKIPLNLLLFTKVREGSIDPEEKMTYLDEDYEGGTGSIQYEKKGGQYTIRDLSKYSIELSDNVATNMLLRLLGRKNLKDYMRELGGIVVDDTDNISCPKDMALYMKKVDEFCQNDTELEKELMGYFENTVFNDRLPSLLPDDVKVAHKTGNQIRAVHDVGIVFTDEPYVISVMSKDINEDEAYDVIANISKKIFDFNINT